VLAGQIAPDISARALECFAGAFSIVRGPVTVERAMASAGPELRALAEEVTRQAVTVRFG
jgi:glycerate kinase